MSTANEPEKLVLKGSSSLVFGGYRGRSVKRHSDISSGLALVSQILRTATFA